MKEIIFFKQAKISIEKFPKAARIRIAALLEMLKEELDLQPKDFKSMSSVAKGVYELRIRIGVQYRVFYVAKFSKAIYVLHAFNKKTQKTSQKDIDLGQKRFKELLKMLDEEN